MSHSQSCVIDCNAFTDELGMGLTLKQQRFVEEYLIDLNGTAAYQRAGYKATARTARSNAVRLLANASIQAAIQVAQEARAHRVHLRQDAVLHELAVLLHSNIQHYCIDDYGNVGLAPHAPRDAMRAVASLKKKITHTETGVSYETQITLWNKPASLRMGGEHLGLFKGTTPDLPDIHIHVDAARERLAARMAHLAARHAEEARNGH